MYHMHWPIEEVQKLTLPQLNWISQSLKEQKAAEARAARGRR